jgi:hypothetical protein
MRTRTKIIIQAYSRGFKAHLEETPGTWEWGQSRAEAIGKLVIAYAAAWQDQWPGLEVEDLS